MHQNVLVQAQSINVQRALGTLTLKRSRLHHAAQQSIASR
jgi:hypothetical protein